MRIVINPLDTLFFKDGKPFTMGEETWADGIFPPPPSVLYGALRTAYFGAIPSEFLKAGEEDDPTCKLKITDIYLRIAGTNYLPLPQDLVVLKKEKNPVYAYPMNYIIQNFLSCRSGYDILKFNNNSEEVENPDNGIISFSNFLRYLRNPQDKYSFRKLSDFVLSEPKVGVGREDSTRTTSEGKLYRVGMRRTESQKEFGKTTEKLEYVVEFEGIDLPDKGVFKFGAEGKLVSYSMQNEELSENTEDIKGNEFKIYLSTPALFKKGWIPDFDENPVLKKHKIELITAAIGKPLNIGGFDMKKRVPKAMLKAVPAGSVYYVRSENCISTFINEINANSISDFKPEEGYGICYIGGLSK